MQLYSLREECPLPVSGQAQAQCYTMLCYASGRIHAQAQCQQAITNASVLCHVLPCYAVPAQVHCNNRSWCTNTNACAKVLVLDSNKCEGASVLVGQCVMLCYVVLCQWRVTSTVQQQKLVGRCQCAIAGTKVLHSVLCSVQLLVCQCATQFASASVQVLVGNWRCEGAPTVQPTICQLLECPLLTMLRTAPRWKYQYQQYQY